MNIPETNIPRIIVIGGGFGGISFINQLQKVKVQIVLFDRHNYHTFQPLLYQVSTAGLEPDSMLILFGKFSERIKTFILDWLK